MRRNICRSSTPWDMAETSSENLELKPVNYAAVTPGKEYGTWSKVKAAPELQERCRSPSRALKGEAGIKRKNGSTLAWTDRCRGCRRARWRMKRFSDGKACSREPELRSALLPGRTDPF